VEVDLKLSRVSCCKGLVHREVRLFEVLVRPKGEHQGTVELDRLAYACAATHGVSCCRCSLPPLTFSSTPA